MKNWILGAVTAASVIGAGVAAQAEEISGQIPVSDTFFENTIIFNPGQIKAYTYKMKLSAEGGKIAVCGAGVYLRSDMRSFSRKAMRGAILRVNGQDTLKDLSFFSRYKNVNAMNQGVADCKLTDVPVPKGQVRFEIDYGHKTFRD